MNYYIHNVPGRVRVKSPVVKRNATAADELKKMLSTLQGIATIDINLTTGSLLVNYNPKTVAYTEIVSLLQRKGYFNAEKAITHDQYIQNAVSRAGKAASKAVLGAFAEKALEGSGLSFLAFLI
ncbi:MAG: hypothetical protein K8I29_00395 [Alphaproteobacteria bacterium]|uniref:Heavy-metal-associated domain-containing protein n=1 Tax=Candidatus Nitrobium versatile TaxID=2884831 RepID=A0A953J339_9BACT|nr:hypothetical protein [Candidatus Nitrobium versatile]